MSSPSNTASEVTKSSGPVAAEPSQTPPEPAQELVPADPEVLQEQIKLIQLCFGEHEFGVPLRDTGDAGSRTALPSSSATDAAAALQPFSAKQFVNAKLQHGVSLEVLCKDLDVFVTHVQGQMKRHVNTELHDAFINASGRLVGMEAELQCAQQPLTAAVKRVAAATSQINEVERTVQSKMQHACEAEKERQFDENCLRGMLLYDAMADYLDEVEPALREDLSAPAAASRGGVEDGASRGPSLTPPRPTRADTGLASPSSAGGGLAPRAASCASWRADAGSTGTDTLRDSTLRCLERLTQSSVQLHGIVTLLPPLSHRDKDTAEMQQLADSASDATAALVQQAFARVCFDFFENPSAAVTHQLRQLMTIYAQASAESRFVAMFSDAILRPFFDNVLSWKAATQARQSTRDMVRLLDDLHDSVANKLAPLLLLVRRAFQGRLMPVVELLWPALCEGLIKKLVTLYDAAIPEAFHQKYVSAYRLYSLVESLCGSREELDALRASPDVVVWNHKWNTDVYMALRQAELHKALDASLQQPLPTAAAVAASSGYFFAPMQVLDTKVAWLLSPDVFLFVCAPKMLREAVTAVELVLEKLVARISASPAGEAAAETTQRLVQLLCDMTRLQRDGTAGWLAQLTLAAADSPLSIAPMMAVVRLVQERLLPDGASLVRTRISQAVVAETLPALENIRSVRLSYSHTKKPFPTQASWYVADMVKPFDALARRTAEWGIPAPVRQRALQDAAEQLVSQFGAIAKDTLVTAKKTEDSWEKLRKRKEATAGGAAEVDAPTGPAALAPPQTRVTPDTASDRDKMTTQLFLDLQALLEELTGRGVSPDEELASVQTARHLLRRAEWIMGGDMPEPPDIEVD